MIIYSDFFLYFFFLAIAIIIKMVHIFLYQQNSFYQSAVHSQVVILLVMIMNSNGHQWGEFLSSNCLLIELFYMAHKTKHFIIAKDLFLSQLKKLILVTSHATVFMHLVLLVGMKQWCVTMITNNVSLSL